MDTPKSARTRWLELIAILVCVGIAVGLLLPAVQVNRIGARRTQCANNLKQLSLAVTNFETAKKQLPGIQSSFGNIDRRGKLGSWVVSLLPLIEEQELRDQWDDPTKQQLWEAEFQNLKLSNSIFYPQIAELICPHDHRASSASPLSYLANAGLYIRFEAKPDPVLGLQPYQDISDASEQSVIAQRSANGAFANLLPKLVYNPRTKTDEISFGVAKPIGSRDFKDGMSNTILFTENTSNRSWADVSTNDDSVRYRVGFVWLYAGDQVAPGRPNPTPLADLAAATAKSDTPSYLNARPSSMHLGVFNVAMADGSVTTISNNIDYVVYQAVVTPHTVQSDMPDNQYILKAADYD